MEWSLLPHPGTSPQSIRSVRCSIQRDAQALDLIYEVAGAPAALVLPSPAPLTRTDGLWKTTCLELFVADAGGAYREFNFAPSGQWAAYGFSGRRQGMTGVAMPVTPTIHLAEQGDTTLVSVHLPNVGTGSLRLGITAVIEEKDGTKSYWALCHGGDAPDFHDPDCFVAQLPPAD